MKLTKEQKKKAIREEIERAFHEHQTMEEEVINESFASSIKVLVTAIMASALVITLMGAGRFFYFSTGVLFCSLIYVFVVYRYMSSIEKNRKSKERRVEEQIRAFENQIEFEED